MSKSLPSVSSLLNVPRFIIVRLSAFAFTHCVTSSQWTLPDEVMVKSSVIVFLVVITSSVETVSAYEWVKNVKKKILLIFLF